MKKTLFVWMASAISMAATAQGFEFGIKAGLTGTSGTTKLPENKTIQSGGEVTANATTANSNGIGFNFLGGVYGKVNLPLGWFVLGEVQYAQFTLKQKAENVSVNVNRSPFYEFNQNYSSIDISSQLNGINIPVFIGKQFLGQKLRVYIGPQFLFVTKVEQKRTFNGGNIELISNNTGNPDLSFNSTLQTSTTENLANNTTGASANRKVVTPIIGLEAGIGVTLPVIGIGVDLRYSVPLITGVYENKDIKGYLGITTLSVSYKLFKLGL